MLSLLEQKVYELLKGPVEQLGYQLWGVSYYKNQFNDFVLCIYIDKEEGISVEDCSHVSLNIHTLLDVHDPISSAYMLEVSSPGLERPFFFLEQFLPYLHESFRFSLRRTSKQSRRKMVATLLSVDIESEQIIVELNNEAISLSFSDIKRASLNISAPVVKR